MGRLLLSCRRGGRPSVLFLMSSSCSQNSLGVTLNTEEPLHSDGLGAPGYLRESTVATAFKKKLLVFPVIKTHNWKKLNRDQDGHLGWRGLRDAGVCCMIVKETTFCKG